MSKRIFVVVFMVLAGFSAFANGNAEKLTTVEGTVVFTAGGDGEVRTMLRTAEGTTVVVDMPNRDTLRLQLREEARIRVSGIFVGVPAGEQEHARILARVVNADGKHYRVERPIQLTERDRQRIRECESERLQAQTQALTQDESQLKTQLKTQTRNGSGSDTGTNGNASAGHN